ncbi:hypothetical protein BDR07DRAFT_793900 [Suillus spraguei]|nr:hypothetical protein BDR07DRAFT_793900 [Suillus spraguei]
MIVKICRGPKNRGDLHRWPESIPLKAPLLTFTSTNRIARIASTCTLIQFWYSKSVLPSDNLPQRIWRFWHAPDTSNIFLNAHAYHVHLSNDFQHQPIGNSQDGEPASDPSLVLGTLEAMD